MKTVQLRSAALIAALSCATLLSACGGSDSDESTTATTAGGAATDRATTSTAQATTTTEAAKETKAALSCADVPASLVNSALGTTVEDPTSSTRQSGAIQCSYDSLSVTITLDNAATAASFETNKADAELVAKSTPVSGLGDEAFLVRLEVPGTPTVNAIYAREGSRAVSVTSVATVEQETALLNQLLTK